MKKLALICVLLILLTACDKTNNLPIEMISEMVTDVAADYNLMLEADEFGEPEAAILAIYAPEVKSSGSRDHLNEIPYTEVLVNDLSKINIDEHNSRLLSTAEKNFSIYLYLGNAGKKDTIYYIINDDETVTFKPYDITVPLGNIVTDLQDSDKIRYIIFVPRWTTLSNVKSVIDGIYEDVKSNAVLVIEEALKHIDIEK